MSVSATIISSGCSSTLTWKSSIGFAYSQGYYPMYKAPQSVGTVKHCATKLRLADGNSSKDYYMLDVVSDFTTTSTSGFDTGSPWSVAVASNKSPVGNEYAATPTFSRGLTGCSGTLSVGFSLAGISISTGNLIDCSTTVTRSSLGTKSARWTNPRASSVDHIELAFSQAVTQGVVPTYTVTAVRPYYTYSWTQVQQCVRGSCYMGWKPTQTGSSASWVPTR